MARKRSDQKVRALLRKKKDEKLISKAGIWPWRSKCWKKTPQDQNKIYQLRNCCSLIVAVPYSGGHTEMLCTFFYPFFLLLLPWSSWSPSGTKRKENLEKEKNPGLSSPLPFLLGLPRVDRENGIVESTYLLLLLLLPFLFLSARLSRFENGVFDSGLQPGLLDSEKQP